ncbi:ClpXP protease specificity-enhancing factor SspB [Paracoccus litorisediminis]|uniref:Uncharacterized protein n=1 Tax=Paracoccus litorisediminis TaxID=2006130 RepID=A0A844HS01_9RHOB|nr:ClpXP protease specificity-enhancing factor SspB [Paracoccus litorisediminis]MTH61107.1 hypothetical protein [Paracoccus litorisediminis]
MSNIISLADFRKAKEAPVVAPQAQVETVPVSGVSVAQGIVVHDESMERFNYEGLTARSLLSVVWAVLHETAINGLPKDASLLIRFRTDHPGVEMPAWLREKHPEDITVLIDQWWQDLEVELTEFSVTLNFNDVTARLRVPFSAITAFVDQSVNFAMQFAPNRAPDTTPPTAA